MTTSNPLQAFAEAHPTPAREQWWVGDDLLTVVASAAQTGRAYSLFDARQPVGHRGPPPHIHDDCGEGFYILEGAVQVTRGDEQIIAGPGQFAFVPAGAVHTFRNIGNTPSRLLILTTPGGLDEFFRLVGAAEPRDAAEAVFDPRPVTEADIDRLLANLAPFNMRLP